jgi:hypothetical protein
VEIFAQPAGIHSAPGSCRRTHHRASRESASIFRFQGAPGNWGNTIRELHNNLGLTALWIARRFFFTFTENPAEAIAFFVDNQSPLRSLPQGWNKVRKAESEWQVYRTRFLIRARQLTGPLEFRDALGREHRGQRGDYLVESSDGTLRIAPREIFEDVYVTMGLAMEKRPLPPRRDLPISDMKRRTSARAEMLA